MLAARISLRVRHRPAQSFPYDAKKVSFRAAIAKSRVVLTPIGPDIIEIDYLTGTETPRADFPTPSELWSRYRAGSGLADDGAADSLLAPGNHAVGKGERD